jgi:hypothetical protein
VRLTPILQALFSTGSATADDRKDYENRTTPSPSISPEISRGKTDRAARPPDLPPQSLMAVDFAIIGSFIRSGRPRIRFLSIGPRLCSTLPSDPASRRCPCASLILRHHQAGWRTSTSQADHARHTEKSSAGARLLPAVENVNH